MVCYAVQHNLPQSAEGTSGLCPNCVATSVGSFIGDNMKEIPLTQGKITLVDDEDYEYLMQWKWYAEKTKSGFMAVRHSSTKHGIRNTILMHRLIMRCPKNMQVDHIHHDELDNRKNELRICTNRQNCHNRIPTRGLPSPFKGVYWDTSCRRWRSRITINGKLTYIGIFVNEIDAARAYDKKAKEHFGNFAYLNF